MSNLLHLIIRMVMLLPAILMVAATTPGAACAMEHEVISSTPDTVPAEQEGADADAAAAGTQAVALVNGRELRLSELANKTRQLASQQYRHGQITPELSRQLQQKALHQLIVEELAYGRALEMGFAVEPQEVDEHIRQLKQELSTDPHFQSYLEKRGVSEEELRREVGRFLVVQKAIAQEVEAGIGVSEKEVELAYEHQKEKFVQHEKVVVTDIVFFLDPGQPESIQKAEEIRKVLLEKYDRQPAQLPIDPLYAVMPEVRLTIDRNPVLYEAAKKLEPNAVSGVIDADATLHVIKLTGYLPHVVKTAAEVRPYLQEQLMAERKREALETWKKGLQETADIQIYHDMLLPQQ